MKYELLNHFSFETERDTILNYQVCKDISEEKKGNDSCLIYLENKKVILFRGSYYVKSGILIDYIGKEKFKKYVNKDIKF